MKLVLKEFLSQMKESGELDRLLPDLLSRMKIIPISRAQVGVRQNGVDVAAVGKDGCGTKTLFLFVLKVGDLGRRDWDGGVNGVRATLNQVLDSYLQSSVRSEHKHLPVKIVVCSTGDLKQDVLQDFNGFVERNRNDRISIVFWSGDDLASHVDAHLLDEYAIDVEERRDLRRAIALIGSNDYDLRHVHKILKNLLLTDHESETCATGVQRKKFVRQLRTVALVLEIVFRWANEEGNLLNALRVGERCCLWAWESIRVRGLFTYRPVVRAYADIYGIHERICRAYFEKLQRRFLVRDGVSIHASESALVTDKVFEQIGILAEIGIIQLQHVTQGSGDVALENARVVATTLAELIRNNPSSGSPRYDGNAIEVSMALFLLYAVGLHDAAKDWLGELARRLDYTFKKSRWFPISTDSFDDLVAMDAGDLTDEEVRALRQLSTLVPTLMYWAVAFQHDRLYSQLQSVQSTTFEGVCLQLWYPDELTESVIYGGPAQFESGVTEAPMVFPREIEELIARETKKLQKGAIQTLDALSAMQQGMPALVLMACRHFRTPFPPQLWMKQVTGRSDGDGGDLRVAEAQT